jgi:hypothetical protein
LNFKSFIAIDQIVQLTFKGHGVVATAHRGDEQVIPEQSAVLAVVAQDRVPNALLAQREANRQIALRPITLVAR